MRLLERAVWSVLLVWVCEVWWGIYLTVGQAGETARRKPRLKARRPEDCPACQSRQGLRGVNSRPTQAVRPWRKARRGARSKATRRARLSEPGVQASWQSRPGCSRPGAAGNAWQDGRDQAPTLPGVWQTLLRTPRHSVGPSENVA
jgi:hypothetical protein